MKAFHLFLVFGTIVFFSISPAFALDPLDQAQLFIEKGMDDHAIEILIPLTASEDEERLSQVVEMLYSLYSFKGDEERAIQSLETFVQRFPQSSITPLYLYWTAKLEEDRNQPARAQELYRYLIEQRLTTENDVYELLPLLYEDLAFSLQKHDNNYPAAIEILETFLKGPIYPEERGRIMNQVASLYEKMKDVDRAKQIYREVVRSTPECPAKSFAALRLIYLDSDPTWARNRLDTLVEELKGAFSAQDVDALANLAKAGDFQFGLMYSEFELGEFSLVEPYMNEFLPYLIPVFGEPKQQDNGFHIKIENWPDTEYDIMYLVIDEGMHGWEWTGIVLSSHELEASL